MRVQNDKNGFAERLRGLAFQKGANYADIAKATGTTTRQSVSLKAPSLDELAKAIVEMRDLLKEIREELRSGKGN